jgi:hypothetical protein
MWADLEAEIAEELSMRLPDLGRYSAELGVREPSKHMRLVTGRRSGCSESCWR